MRMAKRIFLFLAVNILVVVTLSLILNLLHVGPYLSSYGIDYSSLLIFCFVWGMGGAFISLALSRSMAKWLMGVRLIDPETTDQEHQKFVALVYALAKQAGLSTMPQVGIYTSPEINAFATGPSKKRSLVAVSSGLLNKMGQQEIEGVLAHEIAHIANGDMVTMTLIQGVVNAFVMFLARILAYAVSGMGKNRESNSSNSFIGYTLFVFVFEIVFMLLGSMVVAAFSRFREYRADKGGAHLAGKEKMISALEALKALQRIKDPLAAKPSFEAMKISSSGKSSILTLFATHPPLEKRIERLQSYN